MRKRIHRREVLKSVGAACAAVLLPRKSDAGAQSLRVAGQDVEIQIASVSPHTLRLTIVPIAKDAKVIATLDDGSLIRESWGEPVAKFRGEVPSRVIKCGKLTVKISPDPLSFAIGSPEDEKI